MIIKFIKFSGTKKMITDFYRGKKWIKEEAKKENNKISVNIGKKYMKNEIDLEKEIHT